VSIAHLALGRNDSHDVVECQDGDAMLRADLGDRAGDGALGRWCG
jgi:hypothetical protein